MSGRDAEIKLGSEIMEAIASVTAEFHASDDNTLAIYITTTEKMLAAAKEERSRRLAKVFLPPAGS